MSIHDSNAVGYFARDRWNLLRELHSYPTFLHQSIEHTWMASWRRKTPWLPRVLKLYHSTLRKQVRARPRRATTSYQRRQTSNRPCEDSTNWQ